MSRPIRLACAILIGWTLGIPLAAEAGMTMSETFSATIPNSPLAYSQNVSLRQFDTSLGTLQAITIGVTGTVNSSIDVYNFNSTMQYFLKANATSQILLTGPASLSLDDILMASYLSPNGVNGTGVAPSTSFVIPGVGPVTVPGQFDTPGVSGTDSISSMIAPGGFGAYEGTGNSTVTLNANFGEATYGGTVRTGSSALAFGGAASAGAIISIKYDYVTNVVPEPASWFLSSLGFLGTFTIARRLRRPSSDPIAG